MPYETPIVFSNRGLAHFLDSEQLSFEIEKSNLIIKYDGSNKALISSILRAIFENSELSFGKNDSIRISLSKMNRIPYVFQIPREGKEKRKLSVIHPANQLFVMAFFEKYGETILYYCNKSHFSIRYPAKKTSWLYYRDKTHFISQISNSKDDSIEELSKEYEVLKSFYSYKKYSNVYKFYDSAFYNKLECSFAHLIRIDISHFFDSIYTHSICWQIYGKEYSKVNVSQNLIENCFGDLWDSVMQKMNYNETNGIVIGPEFSRVFAEVISQKIDSNVEEKLRHSSVGSLSFGKDYCICRYVDDYFVFYNSEDVKNEIVHIIREEEFVFF